MAFLLSCSFFSFHFTSLFLYFFFQGLGLLKRVSSLKEEACQLEEEAQCLETEGLAKVEVAVAGSEVEGFYRLLRGAIAHTPYLQPHLPLRKLTMPHPPLSPVHPLRSLQVSHLKPLSL